MSEACRSVGLPAEKATRYARLANERYIDVTGSGSSTTPCRCCEHYETTAGGT